MRHRVTLRLKMLEVSRLGMKVALQRMRLRGLGATRLVVLETTVAKKRSRVSRHESAERYRQRQEARRAYNESAPRGLVGTAMEEKTFGLLGRTAKVAAAARGCR